MTLHAPSQVQRRDVAFSPAPPQNKVGPAQGVLLGRPLGLDFFRVPAAWGVCFSPSIHKIPFPATPSSKSGSRPSSAWTERLGEVGRLRAEAWSSTCQQTTTEGKQPHPPPSSSSAFLWDSFCPHPFFPLHLTSKARPNCHPITLWP